MLQRGLPRPTSLIGLPVPKTGDDLAGLSQKEAAEQLLLQELHLLLEHDNAKYPVKAADDKKKKKKDKKESKHKRKRGELEEVPVLEEFTEEELAKAKELLKVS